MFRCAPLLLILFVLLASATSAAAATPSGSFAGSLGVTVPKGAQADVRAINRGTGQVVKAGKVSRTGAFSLKLPAGAYQVIGTVASERARPAIVSAALTLKGGQKRTKANVKKARKKKKKKTKTRSGLRYVQEGGQVTAGHIAVGIHPFSGPSEGEASYLAQGMASLLTADVVEGNRCGLAVVEIERRADVIKELEFQQSKYVDPSSRVPRNLIEEQVEVRGTVGRLIAGKVAVTVTMVDKATGKSLGALSATIHDDDPFGDVAKLGSRLNAELCTLRDTFQVTLDLDATVDTSTYAGRGAIHQTITAKQTGPGATTFTGAAMLVWDEMAITASKMSGCSLSNPVSQTRPWDVTIQAPEGSGQLQVTWAGQPTLLATSTMTCPSTGLTFAGVPFLTLYDVTPQSFTVAAAKDAEQSVSWNQASTSGTGTLKLKYPAEIVREG